MRLIDADALKRAFCNHCDGGDGDEPCTEPCVDIGLIETAPTVDAVPVVRCKDCVYKKCVNDSNGEGLEYCGLMFCIITDNFYCGHGERKEDQ